CENVVTEQMLHNMTLPFTSVPVPHQDSCPADTDGLMFPLYLQSSLCVQEDRKLILDTMKATLKQTDWENQQLWKERRSRNSSTSVYKYMGQGKRRAA
ncbi:hypothetical protein QQF64_022419, partial [Cirrhinus molitorella]